MQLYYKPVYLSINLYIAGEACVDTFKKYSDRNSEGGESNSADDLDDCKANCLADEDCFGLDWSPDGDTKCWLHMDAENLNEYEDNDNVDQYVRVDCKSKLTLSLR